MDKKKLIEQQLTKPVEIGDHIDIQGFNSRTPKSWGSAKVIDIVDNTPIVEKYGNPYDKTKRKPPTLAGG